MVTKIKRFRPPEQMFSDPIPYGPGHEVFNPLREGLEDTKDLIMILESESFVPDPDMVCRDEDIDKLIAWMLRQPYVSIDIETEDLSFAAAKMAGISVGNHEGGFNVFLRHSTAACVSPEAARRLIEAMTGAKLLCMHNALFDLPILAVAARGPFMGAESWIRDLPPIYDTYLAAWGLDQNRPGGNGLKYLSSALLDIPQTKFVDVVDPDFGILNADPRKLSNYAIADVVNCSKLRQILVPYQKDAEIYDNFTNVIMPFVKVIAQMIIRGVCIDKDTINVKSEELSVRVEEAMATAAEIAPGLDIASNEKLATYLFDPPWEGGLGLPMMSARTQTGKVNTDEDHLDKVADALHGARPQDEDEKRRYAIGKKLLGTTIAYRKAKKEKSTYIDGFRDCSFGSTVFAQWRPTAKTGRMRCSEPNLMNLPRDGDVRSIIRPREGMVLWGADYPQIEYRLAVDFSNETELLESILRGEDLHIATALRMGVIGGPCALYLGEGTHAKDDTQIENRRKLVANWSLIDTKAEEMGFDAAKKLVMEEVFGEAWEACFSEVKKGRTKSKTIGYGSIYGMEAERLARTLDIPIEEAKDLLEAFRKALPNMAAFKDHCCQVMRERRYAVTILGFKRWFRDISGASPGLLAHYERAAFNTYMQGSTSDLIKVSMIRIQAYEEFIQSGSCIIMQVHDEIVSEIPRDHETRHPGMVPEMARIMSNPLGKKNPLRVPVDITWNLMDRWSK